MTIFTDEPIDGTRDTEGKFFADHGPSNELLLAAINDGQLKLIKTRARMVRHARRIVFQMAEVAVSRALFAALLKRIDRLRLASG